MSGERPKDVNGQDVELGVPYWGQGPAGNRQVGDFGPGGSGNYVFSGLREWVYELDGWQFVRAPEPSFGPSPPPAGTVRVRGMVATRVDNWSLYGFDGATDEQLLDCLCTMMDTDAFTHHYFEALVPLPPQPTTVEGTATHGE